ncbi:MAG: MFS transporter [Alphaproteobacteria bacterium]
MTKIGGGRPATAKPGIIAWCFYDWANSAFPAVISTFVFSTYFTQAVAENPTIGTAQWSWAITASALFVAALGPVLGAISDAAGPRKPWLLGFTLVSAVACGLMWFVHPHPYDVVLALALYAVANAAFEFGTVFYNAMLADIAPPSWIGRISGWGWGLGYAGGLACLVVVLVLFVQAESPALGLERAEAEHVRVVGPLAGVWYFLFALPLFLFTPDIASKGLRLKRAIREGSASLWRSLRHIREHGNVVRYLIAHMIYTDGLNTLFAFGGIFAAGSFGMTIEEVTMFGIALNVTAGLGAAAFAWIDDWIGAKRTIALALVGLTLVGGTLLLVTGKAAFWVLALLLGVFFGPAQAASRSLMARLAPAQLRTEMFGLFAMSGKATSFVGPFVLGWVTLVFDSQRVGMATVLVFFVVGLGILIGVREPRLQPD